MTRTYKALSALLGYPSTELQAGADDLRAVIAGEALVEGECLKRLEGLIDEIATADIYDCQERYTLLFDRTRSLSLHLFEHVHGESRDRGQAMIDLKDLYEKNGLAISAAELPDFLPLFLEFLSTRPLAEAATLLGQTTHILEALGERLDKRESTYAAIFHALTALAAVDSATEDTVVGKDDDDPMDFEALDRTWEDAPVSFGPESAPGCKDDLIARLRAARRPAAAPPE